MLFGRFSDALALEHFSFTEQQPIGRNAIILYQWQNPLDLKEPLIEVVLLRVQMAAVYTVFLAIRIYPPYGFRFHEHV